MRQVINQTKTPIYENGRLVKYRIDTDTIEVPDPTPTQAPAAVRTLTTTAQACARCGQTGCRCTTPLPRTQADDAADWQPRTILHPEGKDTQPGPMSPELRALRTQEAEWWNLYWQCGHHLNCLVPDRQLRSCSTEQLTALYGQLQSGRVVKEWRNEVMEAWAPKGLLGAYRP